MTPVVNADKRFSVVIPDDNVFSFTATDVFGYTKTDQYLATDQTVNPVFKLRINETLLDTVKPLADAQGPSVAHLEVEAPFHARPGHA